jgi:hypothetical protein
MITPTVQLVGEVTRLGQKDDFDQIRSQLVVGDKDSDATKLKYMLDSFDKRIKQKCPGISVESEIIPIEPIQGATGLILSATAIREIAWKSLNLAEFNDETYNYYGNMSKIVYDGINLYNPYNTNRTSNPLVKPKSYKTSNPLVVKTTTTTRKGGSRLKGTKKVTKKRTKRRLTKGTKKRIKRRNNN